MICELQIKFFFHPFGILWYKFLSYIEVLHVLSELSKLLELSELIEPPEVFSSMKKCLFRGALRLGDPLIKLLELRFVSSSSGTIQTSQSSISSHPVFPDVLSMSMSFHEDAMVAKCITYSYFLVFLSLIIHVQTAPWTCTNSADCQ